MGALGETIRHLRQARGLSARALAEAAGLPYGAVQDIERQRSKNPKSETLRRIAKALGVSVIDYAPGPDDHVE